MAPIPRLVAHRGWASCRPENTLESLTGALEAGARYVEFDIQLTADGVPVVIHDATLERTANRPGCVMDMRWEQLADVTVGESARFGDVWRDARLPSLAEVVDLLLKWPGTKAFPEIKTESLSRFGPERVLDRCAEILRPIIERCVPTSFSDETVEMARKRLRVPVAWVLSKWDQDNLCRAESLGADFLFCNHEKLPADLDRLPALTGDWVLYEVKEADLALALAARGATYIETMTIGELLADPRLAEGVDLGA